ncbi:MAG: hypothetical protein K0S75_2453 [Clostridia bacterium]|jgi:AcrR family transcriptional regulator|nr:hypothetical protein [Clostridia bacterium]
MENNNKVRILEMAHQLFDARGYRNVTIQDLADKLGMSKKTIYQYFTSKEEIATEVVEESMRHFNEIMITTEMPVEDPLSEIREMLGHAKDESTRFSPLFLMDIEKYLPDLFRRYRQFRDEKKKGIEQLLKNAQDMGLVRDIPIHLATQILSVSLKALVKSEFFTQHGYSMSDVLNLFLEIFCNGIAATDAVDKKHK